MKMMNWILWKQCILLFLVGYYCALCSDVIHYRWAWVRHEKNFFPFFLTRETLQERKLTRTFSTSFFSLKPCHSFIFAVSVIWEDAGRSIFPLSCKNAKNSSCCKIPLQQNEHHSNREKLTRESHNNDDNNARKKCLSKRRTSRSSSWVSNKHKKKRTRT